MAKIVGVLAHSCNLATERLGLLGCVRLVGHIPLYQSFRCIFHNRFISFSYTIKFEHIKMRLNNISSTDYLNNNVRGVSEIKFEFCRNFFQGAEVA